MTSTAASGDDGSEGEQREGTSERSHVAAKLVGAAPASVAPPPGRPEGLSAYDSTVILVDDAVWPWRGRRWAHLVSDQSYEELHTFAARLGLRRESFQGDHYDVPAGVRIEAIGLGATAVDGRELVRRLRASGLRSRRSG